MRSAVENGQSQEAARSVCTASVEVVAHWDHTGRDPQCLLPPAQINILFNAMAGEEFANFSSQQWHFQIMAKDSSRLNKRGKTARSTYP
jgi:hypothetical protein